MPFDNLRIRHSYQFTGLKDSNEVEIYEGDICRITNSSQVSIYGQVIYSDGSFGVEIINRERWEGYNVGIEPPFVVWFLHIGGKRAEVIGNIYENPELLEALNE